MLIDPTGNLGPAIELHDHVAKNQRGRRIPIHPDLRDALLSWGALADSIGPVIRSERGTPMQRISIVIGSTGHFAVSA